MWRRAERRGGEGRREKAEGEGGGGVEMVLGSSGWQHAQLHSRAEQSTAYRSTAQSSTQQHVAARSTAQQKAHDSSRKHKIAARSSTEQHSTEQDTRACSSTQHTARSTEQQHSMQQHAARRTPHAARCVRRHRGAHGRRRGEEGGGTWASSPRTTSPSSRASPDTLSVAPCNATTPATRYSLR